MRKNASQSVGELVMLVMLADEPHWVKSTPLASLGAVTGSCGAVSPECLTFCGDAKPEELRYTTDVALVLIQLRCSSVEIRSRCRSGD